MASSYTPAQEAFDRLGCQTDEYSLSLADGGACQNVSQPRQTPHAEHQQLQAMAWLPSQDYGGKGGKLIPRGTRRQNTPDDKGSMFAQSYLTSPEHWSTDNLWQHRR